MTDDPPGRFLSQRFAELLAGDDPVVPPSFERLERAARDALDPAVFDHVAGGAGTEDTLAANRAAFRRWRIVPRVLRDVSTIDLRVELFDRDLAAPLLLAPVGSQSLYHEAGELATAAAAASVGIPFTVSTASSRTLESVADQMGDGPRLFQLYWPREEAVAASLVERAEAAGYDAIVLTVDSQLAKWRVRNLENRYTGWTEIPKANLESDPVAGGTSGTRRDGGLLKDRSLTWDDLPVLRDHTSLPILLKGILHPDDARRAVETPVDGVVVSTHGGRQIDGEIGALAALPDVVDAVDGRLPVLFDSGVRTGADVVKALALGADAAFLGRPYIYGLAVGGEAGVAAVVRNVAAELESVLGLAGHASVATLDRSALVRRT